MTEFKPLYKAEQIARRVRELGKQVSRDAGAEPLDVVCILDNGFVFCADLIRQLTVPVRCHFVRVEVRDTVDLAGHERKEIFYTPEIAANGKHVLLVDGVLHSGVVMDFLVKRIGLSSPKSIKTAVLVDKPAERRVPLEPDYVGFRLASNQMVVGYGLARDGLYRNLPYVGVAAGAGKGGGRARAQRRQRKARGVKENQR